MPKFRPLSETKFINDANLVAYYKLEDVSDETANNYDLTNNNSVAFNAAKFGNGADFGTSNSNKTLKVSSLMGTTVNSDKTFACWVKMNSEPSGGDAYPAILSFGYYNEKVDYEITYYIQSGVKYIAVTRYRNGVGTNQVSLATNLGTSVYNHFALTLSGTTLSLLINGKLIGSTTINTGNGTGTGYVDGLIIGSSGNSQYHQSCIVDDVAIFNRALSASEVNELYQGMTLGEYLPNANTKLLLHLNGSSVDSSGNNNHGTDTAITYSQANGKFGQGAGFVANSSSKIDTGSKFSELTNNFTISFFVKPGSSQVEYANILGNHGTNNTGIVVQQNQNTLNQFYFAWGNVSTYIITSYFSLTHSVWSLITIVKTSTAGTSVYVNGVSVATTADNSNVSPSTTRNLWIGQGYTGTGRYFNGSIDEVLIENRAWSASEVKKYYTNSRGFYATL